MPDGQIYDRERSARLLVLLRALAARIDALKADEDLLSAGPELMKIMGDARSELFHYEVRSTYDAQQTAESRRIVEQALQQMDNIDLTGGDGAEIDDLEEDSPWLD